MSGPRGPYRLWLDPGFGASGDMLLGALLGLGADLDAVRADVALLGVEGWSLTAGPTSRAGLSATRAEVDTAGDHHPHRSWTSIDALLAGAALPARVAAGARATFRLLGHTEAAIHRVTIDDVHFHEVGALDAIVDIVGVWSARHHLDVTEIHSGPVGLGNGTVRAAHGLLPAPAPATVDLLQGVPVRPVDTPAETVTPTGAALLATLVDTWGPIPVGILAGSSRGAGGRDPATHPNVVSALLVAPSPTPAGPSTGGAPGPDDPEPVAVSTAVVLATNLDDATPEIIGRTIDRLLAAGADDAWVATVTMKKNRPGHELRALCATDRADELRRVLFTETGTLGVRTETVVKHALARRIETVTIRGHDVAVKVGPHGTKPEHDDLVALSDRTGLPVRQLAEEARAARNDRQR
ncbi:MAG: nickel pincer cofactor biosynthesis protein LarC [Acidimicrobiales bacterium]